MSERNQSPNFMDELIHFTIHDDEYNNLTSEQKALIDNYRDLEFYPKGLLREKTFDRVSEAKRLIKDYLKVISINDGKETNIECLVIGQLFELLNRMYAHEIRELHLEKLL